MTSTVERSPALDANECVQAVLDELKRLRVDGAETVYLQKGTLDSLQRLLAGREQERQPVESSAKTSESPRPTVPRVAEKAVSSEASQLPPPPSFALPEGSKEVRIAMLREKVLGCPVCNANLNPGAKVVFGIGDVNAEIFFCGEAPGADEEMAGEPFVGPAGKLLDKIISAMGLSREGVFIGNIMNWRPQHEQAFGNRPPTDEEMRFCLPYLEAQVEVVQPKVIVALGRTATNGMLAPDPEDKMADLRGKWWSFRDFPVMVTYHPSYLLHNPSNSAKRRVWEDLMLVMERLEMPISDKQRGFFL